MSLPNGRTILDIDSYAPQRFRMPIVSQWRRSHRESSARALPVSTQFILVTRHAEVHHANSRRAGARLRERACLIRSVPTAGVLLICSDQSLARNRTLMPSTFCAEIHAFASGAALSRNHAFASGTAFQRNHACDECQTQKYSNSPYRHHSQLKFRASINTDHKHGNRPRPRTGTATEGPRYRRRSTYSMDLTAKRYSRW